MSAGSHSGVLFDGKSAQASQTEAIDRGTNPESSDEDSGRGCCHYTQGWRQETGSTPIDVEGSEGDLLVVPEDVPASAASGGATTDAA